MQFGESGFPNLPRRTGIAAGNVRNLASSLTIAIIPCLLWPIHIFSANSGLANPCPSKSSNLSFAWGERRSRNCLMAVRECSSHVLHMLLKKHSSRGSLSQWLNSLFTSPQFSIIDTHRSRVKSVSTTCICVPPTTCLMAPLL